MWQTSIIMDKKEYLKNRFKRDFLQYSLLQEDSLSAKEIAEKLYSVIDLNWLIVQGKQEIETLCYEHLSFEKVKVDGKLSNELSQELGYDLKDRIIAEYQNYLNNHSTDEITTAIISKIERSVELQTWSNGIINMQEAIKLLVERVKIHQGVMVISTLPLFRKMIYLKSSIKPRKIPCSNAFKETI